MTRKSALGDLGTFAAIFLPLTAFAEWLLIRFEANPTLTIGFIMWTVGLAALATAKIRNIPIAEFGWHWGPWRYHAIAVGLPLAYCLVAYPFAAALGVVEFGAPDKVAAFVSGKGFEELPGAVGYLAALFITVVGGASASMIRALGEEIGWRGFAAPRANMAFGFLLGTLIFGIVWGSWHLPALYLGPYNGGGNPVWESACFMANVIAMTGTFVWIRMASGSLWPAATLHAAHNLFVQGVFDPLVTPLGTVTMTGEFGVVFTVVLVTFSLPFWVLGQRLWKSQARAAVPVG